MVLDSQLRTPPTARIFAASRQVLIYCSQDDAARRAALEAAGAVVICLPAPDSSRIDLPALMHDLGRREVNELHVEAGGILNGALLQAGLVDELVLYQAPMLLGQGQDAFGGMALAQLQNAPLLEMVESIAIGSDQRIIARLGGHYDF